MVNITIKSKWERGVYTLNPLSSNSCLKIFLNLSVKLHLCIIFSNRLNQNFTRWSRMTSSPEMFIKKSIIFFTLNKCSLIERKAIIRNRYNYPSPPIRDINGKETQTRNNWILMETSLAESQTDSYFPTKWQNGYQKQKRCKRHTHSKTNYNKNKPWQKNCLET